MSELVVDLFEKVEIDQGNGEMVAGALVAGKLHGQAVLHFTTVGQPGELVGAGGVLMGFGQRQKFITCFQSAGLEDETENRFEGQGRKKADLEIHAVFRRDQR